MSRAKKDCMFQYITTYRGFMYDYKNHEDTGLITRKEAIDLWEKYKPQFIRELQEEGVSPEMGIWINCKDNTDYHTSIAHVDDTSETDGRNIWIVKKELANPSIETEF